jgi:hypothetical protein
MLGRGRSWGRLALLALLATNAEASDAPALEQTETLPATIDLVEEQTNPFVERTRSGKIILATGVERTGARSSQNVSPLAAWSKFTLSSYAEYGATSQTTLIMSSQRGTDQDGRTNSGGLGFRTHVSQWNEAWLFAEGMAHFGTGLASAPDKSAFAADLRLGLGTTFDVMERDAFALVTIGPRVIAGDSTNLRIEATFGVRPWASLLLLLQSFNRIGERDYDGKRVSYTRAQASLVWDANSVYSVQLGAFASLASASGRGERGAIAALWRRF